MSDSGFIEFVPGDAPVILSVPHGGVLRPSHIPDRKGVQAHDAHTVELARLYADAYFALTGRRPHLVINLLHRSKLDANRELAEAAEGNPNAEKAWREFHAYIDRAKELAVDMYGWGLYIDLHGHSHAHQRVELGYAVSADDLRLADEALERLLTSASTLQPMCGEGASAPVLPLIRGPMSLGAILERHGVPSVPSDVQRAPEPGWGYFRGGYNVRRHGAAGGGRVSGVQIEVNSNARRDAAARAHFAAALARATVDFLAHHAGLEACDAPIRLRAVERNGATRALQGAVLTGVTDVVFEPNPASETTEVLAKDVTVLLDGEPVYTGERVPAKIALRPSSLAHGHHVLAVEFTDGKGERRRQAALFQVRHVSVTASWHDGPLETVARLSGKVRLAVEPGIPVDELGPVTIRLRSIGSAREYALLESAEFPARIEVDTSAFEDGIYDLIIRAETADGVGTELKELLEFDNWIIVDDPLLPPRVGGWFGRVELLKASRRSDGWAFAGDRPELFYGDADRLVSTGGDQYLIWEVANLRRFEVTLYAAGDAAEKRVAVSVSRDGEHWTEVPYETGGAAAGVGDPASPWRRVEISGAVPSEFAAAYFRIAVAGEERSPGDVQLGHVRLTGSTTA